MSIRVINNIPADEVDAQEQLARDTGALSVQRVKETDGEFTLIVAYPDFEPFHELIARIAPTTGRQAPPAPHPDPG